MDTSKAPVFSHYSVLLDESVEGLNIKPDGIYVDCTLGGGGHSEAIASHLTGGGKLIAIDQDKLGKQAKRIFTDGISDILVKPLENGEIALCFFNKGNTQREMSITFNKLHNDIYVNLPIVDEYVAKDLWTNEETSVSGSISASVAPHGVMVYKIKVK